jgi:hypothetical protein
LQYTEDLNLRPKAIKLREESKGKILCDIDLGSGSLDMISIAQVTTKIKIDKWNTLKNFCTAKETIE